MENQNCYKDKYVPKKTIEKNCKAKKYLIERSLEFLERCGVIKSMNFSRCDKCSNLNKFDSIENVTNKCNFCGNIYYVPYFDIIKYYKLV